MGSGVKQTVSLLHCWVAAPLEGISCRFEMLVLVRVGSCEFVDRS